jgi:pilus assembly protein FimV
VIGTNSSMFKKRALAIAVASCLSFSPLVAEAAGIGKLTVLSGLGQPLKAELDVAASRDEIAGMSARLAPQDAFRQAGIDYPSVLLDLRFSLEKRANGQAVIKVTSVKPVNEPFLDFLVELNWPAGRLVREYTFLLDPPEVASKQTARSVAEARVVETVQGGGPQSERPAQAPSAIKPSATAATPTPRQTSSSAKPMPQPQAEPAALGATRTVQQGDNLRKIATETKLEGVSLDQMLVGLFQKNPDAFVGNNVNRLKAGAILGIPDKAAVEAVSDSEAKKMLVAQSADWNGYRQKLAAAIAKAPAKEDAAAQSGSGKITAKVEDKVAPAEQAKDQVKVSRTEMPAKGSMAGKGVGGEAEQVAKDKALKEAQDRLALLEKNVGELQKLVEMKNQRLAELQQQAAVKKEVPKPVAEVKPVVVPPKVVEPPKPVEPVKVEAPAKVVEEPKLAVVEKPVEPPKPVDVPKPVVQPPKPVVAAVEPPPEPDFIDTLLEDPVPLLGLGGILALLGGFFMVKRRRTEHASVETTTAPGPSSLGPNSVFRMTGGQSVDTGHTPPQTGDFSQTGPGTIDTDEVDPVAEADVYMAYGRDTQAEEILLEALQKDPQRTAIHAKLLEIYANRGSLKQFETLASELYSQTGGNGPEWEKVAALGAGLDPSNPLYGGSRAEVAPVFDADATMIVSPKNSNKSTLVMPGALSQLAELASEQSALPDLDLNTMVIAEPVVAQSGEVNSLKVTDSDEEMSLDFDLGSPTISVAPIPESSPEVSSVAPIDTSDALDFDFGIANAEPEPEPEPEPVQANEARDFSPEGTLVMASAMDDAISTFVGFDSAPDSPPEPEPVQEALNEQPIVDFDLDMDLPSTLTVVNSISDVLREDEFSPSALNELDHPDLTSTVVNSGVLAEDSLEFDVKLTDSVFLGQPMLPNEFDIGSINLDLSAPSVAEVASIDLAEPMASASIETPADELPGVANEAHWEEINTKLDLAKAYEEMGDLEGARELLQEVVGEGPVDLVAQARDILGRIGE